LANSSFVKPVSNNMIDIQVEQHPIRGFYLRLRFRDGTILNLNTEFTPDGFESVLLEIKDTLLAKINELEEDGFKFTRCRVCHLPGVFCGHNTRR
jgi:hypothetical protein